LLLLLLLLLLLPLPLPLLLLLLLLLLLCRSDPRSYSLGASIGYALLAKHANKVGNVILAAGSPGG
jgi:hypothetical protein